MKEFKIKGLKVLVSSKNIKIIDSYQISNREKMREILIKALEKATEEGYKTPRTLNALVKEWVSHNRLYNFYLFRSHTRDADFEANESRFRRFVYFFLGI